MINLHFKNDKEIEDYKKLLGSLGYEEMKRAESETFSGKVLELNKAFDELLKEILNCLSVIYKYFRKRK